MKKNKFFFKTCQHLKTEIDFEAFLSKRHRRMGIHEVYTRVALPGCKLLTVTNTLAREPLLKGKAQYSRAPR
jgi:hypothetical protein